jgi:hypothetical protein
MNPIGCFSIIALFQALNDSVTTLIVDAPTIRAASVAIAGIPIVANLNFIADHAIAA